MSIVQRLHPDPEAESVLRRWCGQARFVWNHCLHLVSIDALRLSELDSFLTHLRAQIDWLAEGPTVVQQGALRDLKQAYANRGKNREHFGLPTPRRRRQHEGFRIRDLRVEQLNRKWGRVQVPKAGWVKFRLTRPFHEIAAATSARVKLSNTGEWSVSFTCTPGAFERTPTGRAIGLDRGCKNTLATDTGELLSVPGLSDTEQKRYLKLERAYDRQHRAGSPACFDEQGRHREGGCLWRERSKRSDAVRLEMNRIQGSVTRRRNDWVDQVTTQLVRDFDIIVLEDLNLANMLRAPKPKQAEDGTYLPNGATAKSALNRMMYASKLGLIAAKLIEKATRAGVTIVLVNPAYTSQECRACGHTSPENRETQAEFKCVKCGHENHADTNAAQNILGRGLAQLTTPKRNTAGRTARRKGSKATATAPLLTPTEAT